VALLTDETGEANVWDGDSTKSNVTKAVTTLISESGLIERMFVVIRKMMGCSKFEKGGEREGCKRLSGCISAGTEKGLEDCCCCCRCGKV
jgi:hypothetical protein